MKKCILFLCCYAFFTGVDAQVSTPQLQSHLNMLDSFYQLTPLEKAYVQTDKNWYTAGETIWFKGYITVDNQLSELSKVVYADLIDERDSIITKTMWKLNRNSCKGNITLLPAMAAGIYKMRLYTMWMLNTPEVIDEKLISIVSPVVLPAAKPAAKPAAINTTPYKVYLFPEGGDLVNGLRSVIAFKITDNHGIPVNDAVLTLEDGSGKNLLTARPFHAGMGSFDVVPDMHIQYKLAIKINGTKYIPDFPAVREKGVTLRVNALNDNRIFYTINKNAADTFFQEAFVIAHVNGQTFYAEKIKLEDIVTGGAISKKTLPHGVVTLTVFSNQMIPLAERLVFVKKINNVGVRIEMNKPDLSAKARNTVRMVFPSDSMNLSVSVSNMDDPPTAFTNNTIASYFLLSSEIKGYVHDPAYYLAANDSVHNAALDLLMQTQGWRRFNWNAIINKRLPAVNYFIETGISVRGIVKSADPKKNLLEAKVNLILKGEDSTTLMAEVPVPANGMFAVNNLDFRKKGKLYLQGSKLNTKNPDANVEVYPNYIDTGLFAKNDKVMIANTDTSGEAHKKKLLQTYYDPGPVLPGGLTLANVTVNTKVRTPEQRLDDQYVSDWYRNSDFTLAVDSTAGFSSIWQYLQGRISGLNISGDMFSPKVNFSRFAGGVTDAALLSASMYEEMNTINGEVKSSIAFFLNEMPVSIDNINSINPKDIALVKVSRTANVVSNASAGSMFIYTRKGIAQRGVRSFDKQMLTGYNYAREYFSPVYETPASKAVIDKRSSLYWSTDIKQVGKEAVIHFYNSDQVKKIKITVEGLDRNGIPVWAEKIVE